MGSADRQNGLCVGWGAGWYTLCNWIGGISNGAVFTLEGLRINSQSYDNLELATKELWSAAACFQGTMSLTSSAYSRWSIVSLSTKSLIIIAGNLLK